MIKKDVLNCEGYSIDELGKDILEGEGSPQIETSLIENKFCDTDWCPGMKRICYTFKDFPSVGGSYQLRRIPPD